MATRQAKAPGCLLTTEEVQEELRRLQRESGQGGSAGCFYPNKENYFWARWGSDRTTTLRTFVGPELPLSAAPTGMGSPRGA